ncbi:unnamed protein product [Amoebophrya sp. A120]|nr:unnamed protein product [Amoebophrya sp. A120]|eukprot:GSA120T00015231001.1
MRRTPAASPLQKSGGASSRRGRISAPKSYIRRNSDERLLRSDRRPSPANLNLDGDDEGQNKRNKNSATQAAYKRTEQPDNNGLGKDEKIDSEDNDFDWKYIGVNSPRGAVLPPPPLGLYRREDASGSTARENKGSLAVHPNENKATEQQQGGRCGNQNLVQPPMASKNAGASGHGVADPPDAALPATNINLNIGGAATATASTSSVLAPSRGGNENDNTGAPRFAATSATTSKQNAPTRARRPLRQAAKQYYREMDPLYYADMAQRYGADLIGGAKQFPESHSKKNKRTLLLGNADMQMNGLQPQQSAKRRRPLGGNAFAKNSPFQKLQLDVQHLHEQTPPGVGSSSLLLDPHRQRSRVEPPSDAKRTPAQTGALLAHRGSGPALILATVENQMRDSKSKKEEEEQPQIAQAASLQSEDDDFSVADEDEDVEGTSKKNSGESPVAIPAGESSDLDHHAAQKPDSSPPPNFLYRPAAVAATTKSSSRAAKKNQKPVRRNEASNKANSMLIPHGTNNTKVPALVPADSTSASTRSSSNLQQQRQLIPVQTQDYMRLPAGPGAGSLRAPPSFFAPAPRAPVLPRNGVETIQEGGAVAPKGKSKSRSFAASLAHRTSNAKVVATEKRYVTRAVVRRAREAAASTAQQEQVVFQPSTTGTPTVGAGPVRISRGGLGDGDGRSIAASSKPSKVASDLGPGQLTLQQLHQHPRAGGSQLHPAQLSFYTQQPKLFYPTPQSSSSESVRGACSISEVQCDVCGKWRIVDDEAYDLVTNRYGDKVRFVCGYLLGANCSIEDDNGKGHSIRPRAILPSAKRLLDKELQHVLQREAT